VKYYVQSIKTTITTTFLVSKIIYSSELPQKSLSSELSLVSHVHSRETHVITIVLF